jgi:hypothetical protein
VKQAIRLSHEFVEFIPTRLEEGTLYVSVTYATVVHKCCCGCGNEVVTPLTPRDWKITFDGETVSLHPSIGNWGFPCQSHYWVKRNQLVWAGQWSQEEIEAARIQDMARNADEPEIIEVAVPDTEKPRQSIWSMLKDWWSRWRRRS